MQGQMKFKITKNNKKGFKSVVVKSDLEYIKNRLDMENDIMVVSLIEDSIERVIYQRMYKDKLLSREGTWRHLEKYNNIKGETE